MTHDLTEPCTLLTWDSDFWGMPIGRVLGNELTPAGLAEIDRWCSRRSIACLYFLASGNDPATVRAAEDGGFRLTDTRVTLGRPSERLAPGAPPPSSAGVTIRPSDTSDIEPLKRIAAVSHRDTRFYFDIHFPPITCQLLYERWIETSCAGYADRVLVADEGGLPIGYVTCHLPAGSDVAGRIGLLGVAPHARGQGIGRRLVMSALNWFGDTQVEAVTVVTQGRNIGAQVVYQRCGFVTLSQLLWYHKWYRLPERETP